VTTRARVLAVLGLALVTDLAIALTTDATASDVQGFRGAAQITLGPDPLHFYTTVASVKHGAWWPYLPGYVPMAALMLKVADATGADFGVILRIPPILASLAIAAMVGWHVGPERRVQAVAAIALSPIVMIVVARQGQMDPVQWLPAVAAIIAWERLPDGRRATAAGLLVGAGIALKTIPGLVLLALLPHARDWRERAALVLASAVIPLAALAPYAIADFDHSLQWLGYAGIPGHGGLSLIAQPRLALVVYAGESVGGLSDAGQFLQDAAPVLVALGVGITWWRLFRRPPSPAQGSVMLILALLVCGVNLFQMYLAYLVPFVVLAGLWRFYVALHLAAAIPLLFRYVPRQAGWDHELVLALFVPSAIALWGLLAVVWVRRLLKPWPSAAAPER
jgi:hypothetical protein